MSDFSTAEKCNKILCAMATARRKIGPIQRDATDLETKRTYSSLCGVLEAVGDVLDGEGIFAQPYPLNEGDRHGVAIRFYHRKSMQWLEYRVLIPTRPDATPSEVAGALTTARRAVYVTALDLRMQEMEGRAPTKPEGETDQSPWATGVPPTSRATPTAGTSHVATPSGKPAGVAAGQPTAPVVSAPGIPAGRQAPSQELFQRAVQLQQQLRNKIGESETTALLQVDLGTRFMSGADARRITVFCEHALKLLEELPPAPAPAGGSASGAQAAPQAA
jgi:hypothetical protein